MTDHAFATAHDRLREEAIRRAGYDDFGADDYREGYDRLLGELDGIGLSDAGASAMREQIVDYLTGRLRSVAGFKQQREAMARPIVRPLIITGIVRSGTTALHKLLSMDPQFQGTEHWITFAPQPRPARPDWPGNPDFERASAKLAAMAAVSPEMIEDHGMAVDTVEESLHMLPQSFCSNMFPSQTSIPEYDAWYKATDDTFSYRHFANNLRLIGANDPDRTWLLKNPTDTFSLQQVLNVFPDAMIVQTHRDPLQAVPSIVNLLAGAHRFYVGEHADMAKVFAREQEMWALAVERADAVKATVPGRAIDIDFGQFVRDQMSVVHKIYDHFDLTLGAAAETAMRDWLAANPRRSTTMQRFTPEDWGGSTGSLVERYAAYRERYGFA
ncbi:sulfotransferase [uncultured Sphingomonas sp.]|uniref:sulfotransferase family protein n=1 Tax=uncultured Sphingomonas sp. TaxID=158754 RepID=UPI0025E2AC4B|nr:sulfotransferase [uncultured Sphingomonas sp.]